MDTMLYNDTMQGKVKLFENGDFKWISISVSGILYWEYYFFSKLSCVT